MTSKKGTLQSTHQWLIRTAVRSYAAIAAAARLLVIFTVFRDDRPTSDDLQWDMMAQNFLKVEGR
jgi:hypothetical protein